MDGTYRVTGWIEGRAGKQAPYWRDPVGGRPAFFVPQAALCNPVHFVHSLRITVADDVSLASAYSAAQARRPLRRAALPLLPVKKHAETIAEGK